MISANDVRSQSFKKGLFGYKTADVDSFKSDVARALDEALAEIAKLKEENDRLSKVNQDNNMKIFELEKKLSGDDKGDSKKDNKSGKKGSESVPLKDSGIKDDKKSDSATSKFFKQAEETTVVGDDDEVFVGEIEEARKPNKAMIGDGEEEGGDDFTFL
ncbi:MAG: DivIVA domain-containing protein [Eubacterium sp.]|nr:DivIVA domain-containing protein [Eubacterium sp.]